MQRSDAEVGLSDIGKVLGKHILIKTNTQSTVKLVYNPYRDEYYVYHRVGHDAPVKHAFNRIEVSLAIGKYNTLLRYNG